MARKGTIVGELLQREHELLGEKLPYNATRYNEYNKQFEELMNR